MTSKETSLCDEKRYEMFFHENSKVLMNFIYYKCGDMQQAEDIVQEAFIKLWKNCAKVTYEKARSYLYTICNNTFLNQVAHKKVVLQHQKSVVKSQSNETPEFC